VKIPKAPIALGVVVILLVGLGYALFNMKEKSEFSPVRPDKVPSKAVWAGGMEGGSWVLATKSEISDQYDVTIFGEDGGVWIRGRFWSPNGQVLDIYEISHFNGGQMYLLNKSLILPIGKQSRSFHNGTAVILNYPEPSPEYTDARKLTQKLLESNSH